VIIWRFLKKGKLIVQIVRNTQFTQF